MPITEILTGGVGIVGTIIDLFHNEPTPEEQKAKAGVWYKMLEDWVHNKPDSYAFATKWKDFLPFAEKRTKEDFLNNNIRGKSYDFVVNVLVGKINDELKKGGFTPLDKEEILQGMGAGSGIIDSSLNTSTSGNLPLSPITTIDTVGAREESKTFFYIMSLLAVSAAVLWISFRPKKRRR